MNKLISKAISSRVFANLLAVFLLLTGIFALQNTTVKLFPTLQLDTIAITVAYPGASPEDITELIIEPIEQKLQGLEGIRKVRAVATQNIASVLVELQSGQDQNKLLNDIKNALEQITVIPDDAEEPQVTIVEADELAVQFVVSADQSVKQIKSTAQQFRLALLDQPSITDVRVEAVADYQINIGIKAEKLEQYGLSLAEVSSVIRSQSIDLTAGEIEGRDGRLIVKVEGEATTAEEFANIVVRANQRGDLLRLRDIADINDGLSDSPVASFYNNKASVVVSVYRIGEQSVFSLVDEALEARSSFTSQVNQQLHIDIWRDESKNLRSRVNLLVKNALIGVLLVIILLMLFLQLRLALWVAAGLVVSFVGSFILLQYFGYTINQLSLFGFILAIGIVVDDAIVVGENIFSKMEQGNKSMEAADKGVSAVALPVFVSTLTTVAVFIPLLFVPGIYGQFLGPIAAIVIFVLILSLVEAFFILPSHLSHIDLEKKPNKVTYYLDKAREKFSQGMSRFNQKAVRPIVKLSASRPFIVIGFFILCFALVIMLIVKGAVKFVFFPPIEGNYVNAQVELSNQASSQDTQQVIAYLSEKAQVAAKEFTPSKQSDLNSVVQSVFASRGSQIGGDSPNASNASSAASNKAWVSVKLEDAATRKFSAKAFERAWRASAGEIPGTKKLVFSSDLVSAGAAVQLNILSRSQTANAEVADKLRNIMENIDGLIDIRDDRNDVNQEIRVSLKEEALVYAITLQELALQLRSAFFGAEAVRIQRDREEIEVRVRLNEEQRSNINTLYEKKIKAGDAFIPISQIAHFSIQQSPSSIIRIDGKNVVTLTSDVDTDIITGGAASAKILKRFNQQIAENYPSVKVNLGGDQEEQQRAGPAMAQNFSIALFVVFALLALIFNSYSQSLVVMAIIPFGLVGAVLGHYFLGLNLTLLSMFGIIGLSGVVINDSLLLMQFINEEVKKGKSTIDAVVESTLARFRPIVLTSLTTFLGVTPIILEQSVQAQFLKPTAVSLGIGILFATFILLFLLPALATLQLKYRR